MMLFVACELSTIELFAHVIFYQTIDFVANRNELVAAETNNGGYETKTDVEKV